MTIRLDQIKATANIRSDLGDLSGLMQSIKVNGILQPIGLWKGDKPDEYLVAWGNRRLNAVKNLGWRELPTENYRILEKHNFEDFESFNALENIQRKPINTLELGKTIGKLIARGLTLREISVKFGYPIAKISRAYKAFKEIPEDMRDFIGFSSDAREKTGKVPVTTALSIANIRTSVENKKKIFEKAAELALNNEVMTNGDIVNIAQALESGKSIDEALEVKEAWSSCSVKFSYDSDKAAKYMKANNFRSVSEMVIHLANTSKEMKGAFRR